MSDLLLRMSCASEIFGSNLSFIKEHPPWHASEILFSSGFQSMSCDRSLFLTFSFAGVLLLQPASVVTAQNTTSPSQNDRKFVRSALEDGIAELQLGQIAVEKAESADVKQFGEKMIQDHTKMSDQMRDIAQKEGISAPSGVTAKDKALESKLKTLSGPLFDRAYIAAMVQDDREDLSAFNREANNGNDTAIKDVASRYAQLIGEHLELAKELARNHDVDTNPK
jgi:putative membrane protein